MSDLLKMTLAEARDGLRARAFSSAELAAACDLRIGAANAKFGFPIARTLGNCLSMNNYARLSALIDAAVAADAERHHADAGPEENE